MELKIAANDVKEDQGECSKVHEVSTQAFLQPTGHVLQEDHYHISGEDDPGRAIAGTISFPQGEFQTQNQPVTGEITKIIKNCNYGDSPSKLRSPRENHHKFVVHNNHQKSPLKSPQPGVHSESNIDVERHTRDRAYNELE